jgi:DNA-binding NarL/FixJ family response regulator
MQRLVFIDDDKKELDDFRAVVVGVYDCTTVHWPNESEKLFSSPPPDIFVSDLYLPSASGAATPTPAQREEAEKAATKVGETFSVLYSDPSTDDKARLQRTMKAITDAYDMLKLQWSALGQSPDHGVALLAELKARYPDVPFVFYSRKHHPGECHPCFASGCRRCDPQECARRRGGIGSAGGCSRISSPEGRPDHSGTGAERERHDCYGRVRQLRVETERMSGCTPRIRLGS